MPRQYPTAFRQELVDRMLAGESVAIGVHLNSSDTLSFQGFERMGDTSGRTWIVVPCFNEAERWNASYWSSLVEGDDSTQWIFVDDGSQDGTRELVTEMCGEHAKTLVIYSPRNSGKAEAVRRGLQLSIELSGDSEGDVVGFMDADAAFTEPEVSRIRCLASSPLFLSSGFEWLWTSRVALAGRNIQRHPARHYVGRSIASIVSLGFEGQLPYDTQSGLKLFTISKTLKTCLDYPFETRWLFEIELLVRWIRLTGLSPAIWEEPLMEWHDVGGSHISRKEALRIIRELFVVKRLQWAQHKLRNDPRVVERLWT